MGNTYNERKFVALKGLVEGFQNGQNVRLQDLQAFLPEGYEALSAVQNNELRVKMPSGERTDVMRDGRNTLLDDIIGAVFLK